MQHARFIRTLVPLVMLGLAGFLLGCSGQGTGPLDQQTKNDTKKVMAERNSERKEAMKGMRKGRGPG